MARVVWAHRETFILVCVTLLVGGCVNERGRLQPPVKPRRATRHVRVGSSEGLTEQQAQWTPNGCAGAPPT